MTTHPVPAETELEAANREKETLQIILSLWIQVDIGSEEVKSRLIHLLLYGIHSWTIDIQIDFIAEIGFMIGRPELGKSYKVVFFLVGVVLLSGEIMYLLHVFFHPDREFPGTEHIIDDTLKLIVHGRILFLDLVFDLRTDIGVDKRRKRREQYLAKDIVTIVHDTLFLFDDR